MLLWARIANPRYQLHILHIRAIGLQAHHLFEKRFAGALGETANKMKSIAVSAAEHQRITNAWKYAIPYKSVNNFIKASRTEVEAAATRIYGEYPEILKA